MTILGGPKHTTGLGDPKDSAFSTSPTPSFEAISTDAISISDYIELTELATDPDAPAANHARLYLVDDGSGNTRLAARFSSGTVWIATDPS